MLSVANQLSFTDANMSGYEVGNNFISNLGIMDRSFRSDFKKKSRLLSGFTPYSGQFGIVGNCRAMAIRNPEVGIRHNVFDPSSQFSHFFDSTLGPTAGKRLMVFGSASNISNANLYELNIVAKDGSTTSEAVVTARNIAAIIFAETATYLYFFASRDNIANGDTLGGMWAIGCYNKNTKAFTVIYNNDASTAGFVTHVGNSNGNYMFVINPAQGYIPQVLILDSVNARYKLEYYNKVGNPANGNYVAATPFCAGFTSPNGLSKQVYHLSPSSLFTGNFRIERVTINNNFSFATGNTDLPVREIIPVVNMPAYTPFLNASDFSYITHTCHSFISEGVKYLAFTPTLAVQHNLATYDNVKHLFLTYIFKILPSNENELVFVNSVKHASQVLCIMPYANGKDMLVATRDNVCYKMTWNAGAEAYSFSESVSLPGVTGNNTLSLSKDDTVYFSYYEQSLSRTQYWSFSNAGTVIAEFESKETMYFDGTPINTNVVVNATDAYGKRVVKQVRLTLTGCLFEDGTNVKVIDTSATASVLVPVVISEAGNLLVESLVL
jgi:hypothetical protein